MNNQIPSFLVMPLKQSYLALSIICMYLLAACTKPMGQPIAFVTDAISPTASANSAPPQTSTWTHPTSTRDNTPTLAAALPTRTPTRTLAPTSSLSPLTGTPIPLPTLPGWPAANFKLHAFNATDDSMTLINLRGKPVMLGFFATWCLPCRYEVPQIIASYEKHKDEIQFVYIDQEEGDHVVQAFIQRESIPYPILMDYDSEVARSYRVLSLPATFFIDSNGRIVNYHLGLMSPDMLENHIQELIGH